MEEMYTKENYLEHVAKSFNKNQITLNEQIDKINEERSLTGFQELRDITPRFFNANTTAVKYFKKNKINYYDSFKTNPDKIAMEAWEFYTKKKYNEAINELVYLKNDIYRILDEISNSKAYKSRIKQRNIYSYLCIKMPNTMGLALPIAKRIPALNAISYSDLFKDSKEHIKKYEELGDSIYELDPDKDILTVFKYYLENMYSYIKNQTYDENVVKNNTIQNDNIKFAFKSLEIILVKLNKKNEVNELAKHYLKLIEQESRQRLEDFKVQYEEFKKTVNIGGTEDIIQEPKNKSLSRRKKSNS